MSLTVRAVKRILTYRGSEVLVTEGVGKLGGSHNADEALFVAAARGEHDALKELWHRHRRWVAAILLAHKPKWADLEDLLQDVGMTLVRKVGELRDPGALKPWLRTVAINAARAAARDKSERQTRRAGGLTDEAFEGVLARVSGDAMPRLESIDPERREEARRVMDLAMQLPEGYREPLLLRCLKDLSYRQIGELVGLPESTIETRIARGRRMLRELAAGRNPETEDHAAARTTQARGGADGA